MDSDNEGGFTLKINEEFAKKYERKKEAEEISKLREKYGEDEYDSDRLRKVAARKRKYGIRDGEHVAPELLSDSDSASSSSDEEEDEIGELVTPAVDAQIMRTLALVRAKDPKLYNPTEKFFSEEALETARKEWEEKQQKRKGEKPVTLKDYQRKVLIEDGGFVDEERELTHIEEQAMLKEDLKRAFNMIGTDNGNAEEEFFTTKKRTHDEVEKEEEDYKRFLLESVADNKAGAQAFKDWQNSRTDSNVDPEEAFLVNYILNRGWIDKDAIRNPTHGEIVGDIDFEEDEAALDAADNFENRYNFRFEEEGGSQLVSYGRVFDSAVRRKDNKRTLQRQSREERKKLEKLQKAEELKRLKNLKKREIFEKLKQIQEITGNKEIGVDDIDLEGDFDPEAYDAKMSHAFDDEYYEQADDEKPVWDDDIDVSDIVANLANGDEASKKDKKGKKKKKKNAKTLEENGGTMEGGEDAGDYKHDTYPINGGDEGGVGDNDEDFIMDADYLPGGDKFSGVKPKKNAEVTATKPKKVGKQDFNDYLDEYYQLDYEDMIGDLPTRFKYTKVKPADFGLTPVEILLADDKDLNEVISLKKLAPYRPTEKEERDMAAWSKIKKRKLYEFRRKLSQNMQESAISEELQGIKGWELPFVKKRKAKEAEAKVQGQQGGKKKKRMAIEDGLDEAQSGGIIQSGGDEEGRKKKKKKKKNGPKKAEQIEGVTQA